MKDSTYIGGKNDRFPQTRWSAVAASASSDQEERRLGFEVIVSSYWKPVYKYIRIRWGKSNEDAKDLTQEFFSLAIEKSYFKDFDPARARFRTFIRTCLDGFLANAHKAENRLKRGGDLHIEAVDFREAEHEINGRAPVQEDGAMTLFENEWIRHLFMQSVDALKKECLEEDRLVLFSVFERYDLSDPEHRGTYQSLAETFKIPVTQVTNHLSHARRRFRRIVLDKLRELTSSDTEFEEEAKAVLGTDVS